VAKLGGLGVYWLPSILQTAGQRGATHAISNGKLTLVGLWFLVALVAQCRNLVHDQRRQLLQNTMLSQARHKHAGHHCNAHQHQPGLCAESPENGRTEFSNDISKPTAWLD